jgi:hypothetical protein
MRAKLDPLKELAGIHHSFTSAKPRSGAEQNVFCASKGNIRQTKFFLDSAALPILGLCNQSLLGLGIEWGFIRRGCSWNLEVVELCAIATKCNRK